MPRLVLEDLAIWGAAGAPILSDFNIQLEQGVLGILGPNGSGKSSCVRCISGFIPRRSHGRKWGSWGEEARTHTGQILIDGKDVSGLQPGERGVSLVPQNLALYPDKSVFENLAFPLLCAGMNRQDAGHRAQEMAVALGIESIVNRRPREISGGQAQRVAIGRALTVSPRLCLLDEPTASLDAVTREEVVGFLRRTLAERNVSAVFVTHLAEEASNMCDLIAFVSEGRVHQVAAPKEAYDRPSSLYVARTFSGYTTNITGSMNALGSFVPQGADAGWPIPPEKQMITDGGDIVMALRPGSLIALPTGSGGVRGRVAGRRFFQGRELLEVELKNGVPVQCLGAENTGGEVEVRIDETGFASLRWFKPDGTRL